MRILEMIERGSRHPILDIISEVLDSPLGEDVRIFCLDQGGGFKLDDIFIWITIIPHRLPLVGSTRLVRFPAAMMVPRDHWEGCVDD